MGQFTVQKTAKSGSNFNAKQQLGGDATDYMLSGSLKRAPWAQLMKQSKAKVVIVNYGINDFKTKIPLPTYKANLEAIADDAEANGKRLILETPNPVSMVVRGEKLSDYAQAMRDVAIHRHLGLIDQFAYMTELIGSRPLEKYMPDGVHPNIATYRLKGEYANKILNELL